MSKKNFDMLINKFNAYHNAALSAVDVAQFVTYWNCAETAHTELLSDFKKLTPYQRNAVEWQKAQLANFQWKLRDSIERSANAVITDIRGFCRNNATQRVNEFYSEIHFASNKFSPETKSFAFSAAQSISQESGIPLASIDCATPYNKPIPSVSVPLPPAKKKSNPLAVVLIVFGVILVLMVIGSGSESEDPTASGNPSRNNAATTTVTTQPPMIEVNAYDLMKEYKENEVAADQKYKGKVFKVTGVVENIGTDILDDVYITLETEDGFYSIQCYFSKQSEIDKVASLQKGQQITLEGRCSGMTLNVIMKNCEIE